ncbi:MAG: glycosyltransferase [Bacteroidetes bacterium]|nr:glycosyltransferase [Bacteroidota bacterium]
MNDAMNRLSLDADLDGGFSNRQARGRLPYPLPNPLRLNLGCGRDIREGFVNIDLYSDDTRVVGMDIRNLQLPDSCADLILASDVLEHFSHRETSAVLAEWARVLKPDGDLLIRCPSLRLQAKAYMSGVWDADIASYMIFGGQTNPGDYHCIGFDEKSIRRHLEHAGFGVLSFEEADTPQNQGFINLNMTVQARKTSAQTIHKEIKDEVKSEVTKKSARHAPFINIVWEGSQFVHHSLALVNRELCSQILRSAAAELTIVPYEADTFATEGNSRYEQLASHDIRFKSSANDEIAALPYAWIRHQWPPNFEPPHGAKWIIMQPWEFSALRKDFAELFNAADEVWTPSDFCRRVFIESGVDFNKVQIVPNGVNPDIFTPNGTTQSLGKRSFTFLYVGGTIFRKGIDILLETYLRTFTAADNVRLLVKDMGGDSFYQGQTAKEFILKIQSAPNAPEISYIDEMLTEEQMAELYRSCDVFVSPYRGEGFSLPALEAMACGLPVIVTQGGATDDFVDDSAGWFIPAGKRSVGRNISGHELTDEGFLLEPEAEGLSETLRYCYDNPAICKSKGLYGSLKARTVWTWRKSALKMFARLDYLFGSKTADEAERNLPEKEDAIMAFARAEQEFSLGNTDEAIDLCNIALRMGGLSGKCLAQLTNRLALIALDDGDVALCEEFLDKSDKAFPDNPDTRYLRSLCLLSAGKNVESLENLNPLLENWRTYRLDSSLGFSLDTALVTSGDAIYRLEAPDDALEIFERALQVNNNNAAACFGAALCLRDLGAPDDALTMLNHAVRLNSEYESLAAEFEKEN